MATSLTARDILTMTSDDLRKYVSDFGQDPKNMTKTDMQTWLIEKVVPSEAASAVEIPSMPSFVSKLSPELQLQVLFEKRRKRTRNRQTRKRTRTRQVENGGRRT